MMKKTKKATEEHKKSIKAYGLSVLMWKVVYEHPDSLTIRNWLTGEFRWIMKKGAAV